MSHFVEIVLVQLAHEASKVAVLEVLREDCLGKLLVLQHRQKGIEVNRAVSASGLHTSKTTKLSPSFPHRTTDP